MNGEGSQLAQVRPGDTAAHTAYTNPLPTGNRGLNVEITLIVVCNTTNAPASYSIFHHNSGTTFNQTTALHYAVVLAANTSALIAIPAQNSGFAVKAGGSIGVQSSVASALTFTLYGVAQQIPTR